MLRKGILAVVVGVVTALMVALVGSVLAEVNQDMVATLGDFLKTYSFLFGVLAGIWYYFTGETPASRV